MRRPMPLLQHPQLGNTPTISCATHSSLDLCRGIDTLFMPVILQRNTESLAFRPPAVQRLHTSDADDELLRS